MNLGAILHLNGKLQEAEANYLRALQLKPDDTITQSNLRKLWNIMEKQGLRTMSPWSHPAWQSKSSSFALLIQERWKRLREDVCSERPWLRRTVLLTTPELCIHLRPAAFLRSIAHSLASATWYLDSLELSSKLEISQEPCFLGFFFPEHLSLKWDNRYILQHL